MVIPVFSFSGLFVIQAVHSQYIEPESVALHWLHSSVDLKGYNCKSIKWKGIWRESLNLLDAPSIQHSGKSKKEKSACLIYLANFYWKYLINHPTHFKGVHQKRAWSQKNSETVSFGKTKLLSKCCMYIQVQTLFIYACENPWDDVIRKHRSSSRSFPFSFCIWTLPNFTE